MTVDPDNPDYAGIDGVLFNKDATELIFCPRKRQGDYVIPASVEKIRVNAFRDCAGLTSIFIPASVKEIESEAFEKCNAILAVHPDNPVYAVEDGKLAIKIKTACGHAGEQMKNEGFELMSKYFWHLWW